MSKHTAFREIAHRGVPSKHPENSLASFQLAKDLGMWAIETDIQLTADGIPVILHDKRLDRTTNTKGLLKDYTFADLSRAVRLTNGEPIPRLTDLLEMFKGTETRLYLEIIAPDGLKPTLTALKNHPVKPNVVLSSFIHSIILEAKQLDPTCRTMALFECVPVDSATLLRSAKADEAGAGFDSVPPELVQNLHAAGIPVFAWTVNPQPEKDRARSLGLDGIFTDCPA